MLVILMIIIITHAYAPVSENKILITGVVLNTKLSTMYLTSACNTF